MSAATSRATSRGPSRTPSRGATQDFDTVQSKNDQAQLHSLETSKKQLLQGQLSSSQPVAEGHGGDHQWFLHRQPVTDRHTVGRPQQTWLQSLLQRVSRQRTGISSSGKVSAEHTRDASDTDMSLFLEILAAQPSQSASSAALLHQYSDVSHRSGNRGKTTAIQTVSAASTQPEMVVSQAAHEAHYSKTCFSSGPQPVAEGTEDRPATKTSQQRPDIGFMSGGALGRSAPATRHAAVTATALGTDSADAPVNSQPQHSLNRQTFELDNQQGELSVAIPPEDLYGMWVSASTSSCVLMIAHVCLELVTKAHSAHFDTVARCTQSAKFRIHHIASIGLQCLLLQHILMKIVYDRHLHHVV